MSTPKLTMKALNEKMENQAAQTNAALSAIMQALNLAPATPEAEEVPAKPTNPVKWKKLVLDIASKWNDGKKDYVRFDDDDAPFFLTSATQSEGIIASVANGIKAVGYKKNRKDEKYRAGWLKLNGIELSDLKEIMDAINE